MATVTYSRIDGRIVAENRGGTRKYYSSDALGSTVALYDNSQTKTDTFTYWPYGETRTRTGSTATKYKFVGTLGCREQADGGIYMEARVEQPQDGRWLTVDPLWPENYAYVYGMDNPTTYVDPEGLQIDVLVHPWNDLKADCLKSKGLSFLRDVLKVKKCASAIKKCCDGKSFEQVSKLISFVYGSRNRPCSGDTGLGCTFMTGGAGSGPPCTVKAICVNSDLCRNAKIGPRGGPQFDTQEVLVEVLLFELGNWCECKYTGKKPKAESCANAIRKACIPPGRGTGST